MLTITEKIRRRQLVHDKLHTRSDGPSFAKSLYGPQDDCIHCIISECVAEYEAAQPVTEPPAWDFGPERREHRHQWVATYEIAKANREAAAAARRVLR